MTICMCVQCENPIQQSVIFANGDVVCHSLISSSIIVCDGDVTVNEVLATTLVVARGNIRVKGSYTTNSTLFAGGKVTLGNKAKFDEKSINPTQENQPHPLGYITFFELSTMGLEVKASNGLVQVAKVPAGKGFAKAGLKAGDVILEANGKKPDSAESLRRLLRWPSATPVSN